MAQRIVHVVFTPSGAGCLRQALKSARRDDEVVAFFDNLSFGPINPPDASRAKWVESELGWTEWEVVDSHSESFWREALSSDRRRVAWLSRRSTMEYAGFLEWLWRLGDIPCEVVDLTDVTVSHRPEHGPPRPPRLAISLGVLPHDIIASEKGAATRVEGMSFATLGEIPVQAGPDFTIYSGGNFLAKTLEGVWAGKSKPEEAKKLFAQAQVDAENRWKHYQYLAGVEPKPAAAVPKPQASVET